MISSTLGFFGAGNMAEALIRGLLETKICVPEKVFASDINQDRLAWMARTFGIQTATDNLALAQACSVLLLAVKPQQVPELAARLRGQLSPGRHIVISIAAGLTTSYLEKAFAMPLKVVRVMPNTPAKLRAGAAAFCLGRYAGEDEERLTRELFTAVGTVVKVEETMMNAVTAVSGSGPAYVFRLCELMVSGGIALGLPPEIAQQLSLQTIVGAARMLAETGQTPLELRQAVTSAGGTTEAALKHLDAGNFESLFKTALASARDRAMALTPPDPVD